MANLSVAEQPDLAIDFGSGGVDVDVPDSDDHAWSDTDAKHEHDAPLVVVDFDDEEEEDVTGAAAEITALEAGLNHPDRPAYVGRREAHPKVELHLNTARSPVYVWMCLLKGPCSLFYVDSFASVFAVFSSSSSSSSF